MVVPQWLNVAPPPLLGNATAIADPAFRPADSRQSSAICRACGPKRKEQPNLTVMLRDVLAVGPDGSRQTGRSPSEVT